MSDEGRMPPRYGFDVNGYARQMHDGYWTPWHIAKDEITALRAAHEALLRRTQSLETALDQERADNERLRSAAKVADWEQVRLNGGPPCFHIEESEFRKSWAPDVLDYRFCLRAERWPGHPTLHKFVTLHDALLSGRGDGGNDA